MVKIIKDLLTLNKYSRPGEKIIQLRGIVIHWVANIYSTAKQNRDFFESRKEGNKGFGSAHFIIDLNGDVMQCVPENEVAYHVSHPGTVKYNKHEIIAKLTDYPNYYTVGIECTHINDEGEMTIETEGSLAELTAELAKKYNLNPLEDLYIHHEIEGNDCHRWYMNHPEEWGKFKNKLEEKMSDENKVEESVQENEEVKEQINEEIAPAETEAEPEAEEAGK